MRLMRCGPGAKVVWHAGPLGGHDAEETLMTQPSRVLLVRFKTSMTEDEVMNVATERAPEFRALKGLQQKYYLRDTATGEVAGLYLWDSEGSLAEYRKSELRASIAKAYRTEGEPRVEVYEVLMPLREGGI